MSLCVILYFSFTTPQWTHYLLTGSDGLRVATAQYQHVVITLRSRQLLKMGTWLPETIWATCKGEIKDNTKWHLVGFFSIRYKNTNINFNFTLCSGRLIKLELEFLVWFDDDRVIRGFNNDTVEDSKCSTTIIWKLILRHVADYFFFFIYTKDINVQQRPGGCQQKFLSQNSLSLSSLDMDIDNQGPFLKCYI